MNNWFEVNIKYNKIDDKGKDKKVSESFLVDAVSFTEAEARIIKEMEAFVSGEMVVSKIKRSKVVELFPFDSGEIWFSINIEMITFDEEAGKQDKTSIIYLVLADDIEQAITRIKKSVDSSVVPYVISSICVSNIKDIFTYN